MYDQYRINTRVWKFHEIHDGTYSDWGHYMKATFLLILVLVVTSDYTFEMYSLAFSIKVDLDEAFLPLPTSFKNYIKIG